ncbi:MAG: RlpA-like double-psi beta-barrel domain-containing protein [Solirubrobacteraceae bacterium]
MAGCGAATTTRTLPPTPSVKTEAAVPQGHPHVVEPVAGQAAGSSAPAQTPAGPAIPSSDPRPTGPATVTKAPAKGAPSNAEVRAAVARFQTAVAHYHLNRLNLSGALLDPAQLPFGHWYQSIASVYTDYGLPIACGGVLHVPQLGVANKTLPCGTKVTFVYGGRAIRVPVIDRGPYIAGRVWDLTGATAEALHFPGLGPIKWRIG